MLKYGKRKRRNAVARRLERRADTLEDRVFSKTQRRRYRRNYSRQFWVYHTRVGFRTLARKGRAPVSKMPHPIYSKIQPTEAEFLFLKVRCPLAILEYKLVQGYKQTSAYRHEGWNGKAWFVTFTDNAEVTRFRTAFFQQSLDFFI